MFEKLFSKTGLSLDRLRSFMLMAEAGSIARAFPGDANRQSQASRQIRELEEFFNVGLTRRKGKLLTLSAAGVRLAALVREQFQDLDDFRREQAGEFKSFLIGTGASILEWLVTPVLPDLSHHLGDAIFQTESHRSHSLVTAVQDGRLDFAVIRHDALPSTAKSALILKMRFMLCLPRRLLKPDLTEREAEKPVAWRQLPFAAGRDGGQTDAAVRQAMRELGVDFRPRFECGSMLQVRRLVEMGACAGVLSNLGTRGLDMAKVMVIPFSPLKDFGRGLVLHWNERQMRRRGLEESSIKILAQILKPK
ncbi:MAG: LysR family transcriptional regulator [Verrucomicrobiota bacterium]